MSPIKEGPLRHLTFGSADWGELLGPRSSDGVGPSLETPSGPDGLPDGLWATGSDNFIDEILRANLSPQQSLGKGVQAAGGSENLSTLFQEPSLNALFAAHMRQMAAEARQGQGSAASDPPRPRQRDAEPAEPPLEFPSCETTNGRRLMTLQDSAEAIGMIPSSWNAAKPNEDSGKSQSTAGPRGTEAVTQAPQAPLAKQGPAGAGPARQDPPIVLILDADGQLRRCPLLEGRVVAVIAAQDVSRASMPASADDLIDACSFNDWSYEEAVEDLARDMGQSRQLVEARIAEVLGVNQPRDGRKRGRPPNSRPAGGGIDILEPTTSDVLVRLLQITKLERQRGILAELLLSRSAQVNAGPTSVKTVTSKLRSVYSSPQEFWDEVEANRLSGEGPQWYRQAVDYWDSQEASDNGVLGGFEELTEVDIADSKKFILKVDLVEPSAHLLEQARTQFSKRSLRDGIPAGHRVVNYYQVGLEQFEPEQGRYDMIWVQWALLYLTDDDVVRFFERCGKALKPGGMLLCKENVSAEGFVVDRSDLSITR
ncbi:hypothetical protein QBZ16_003845 [Prototheca wickerhamii]|uniref:Alpha N-terminal protein methyltransferase 1 n=1 Tax=Prototheca wickerhamii TaxID=3111 RepID=A0AAD9IKP4_PROWI|nr:hypothetical protein QBZ16_003845 [Prototheca wickerhamii]